MKKYIFLLLVSLCVAILGCSTVRGNTPDSKTPNQEKTGFFHYYYPYNTDLPSEDAFIVLYKSEGRIKGYYYGTSDEFDEAREGYIPGFFVLPMNELRIHKDTITFVLEPKKSDFFTQPIKHSIRSSQKASANGYKRWDLCPFEEFPFLSRKEYTGVFTDSATLYFERDPFNGNFAKTFKKEK